MVIYIFLGIRLCVEGLFDGCDLSLNFNFNFKLIFCNLLLLKTQPENC